MYHGVRSDVDSSFSIIYNHAHRLSEAAGTEPCMPRLAGCQKNRVNTAATSVREYYHLSLVIPLFDTISSELDSRFVAKKMDSVYFFFSTQT